MDPGTTDHSLNSSVMKGRPQRCIIRQGALLLKKEQSVQDRGIVSLEYLSRLRMLKLHSISFLQLPCDEVLLSLAPLVLGKASPARLMSE